MLKFPKPDHVALSSPTHNANNMTSSSGTGISQRLPPLQQQHSSTAAPTNDSATLNHQHYQNSRLASTMDPLSSTGTTTTNVTLTTSTTMRDSHHRSRKVANILQNSAHVTSNLLNQEPIIPSANANNSQKLSSSSNKRRLNNTKKRRSATHRQTSGSKKASTLKNGHQDSSTIPLSSKTMKNIIKLSSTRRNRQNESGKHNRKTHEDLSTQQDLHHFANEFMNAGMDFNTLKLKRHLQMVFSSDDNSFLHAIQNPSHHPMPDSGIPKEYFVSQNLERFGSRIVSQHEKEREFDRLTLKEHQEYRDSLRELEVNHHTGTGATTTQEASSPAPQFFQSFDQDPTQSDIIGGPQDPSSLASTAIGTESARRDHNVSTTTTNARHSRDSLAAGDNNAESSAPNHTSTDSYSDTSAMDNKNLVFPTANPTKRLELYLLAKTIDDMLARIQHSKENLSKAGRSSEEQHQFMISHLHATHEIYLIALNEVARQVYVTCVERGVILNKIYNYFSKFFQVVMEIIQQERKKASDFQDLIHEYEKLTNDLAVEKQQQSSEMDRLLKDKTYLFKEREILKRKILTGPKTAPKYDLIIKLLKNTRTRDKLLRSLRRELPPEMRAQVGQESTPAEMDSDESEEDEYFRKFEETDDQDEFFKQFENRKQREAAATDVKNRQRRASRVSASSGGTPHELLSSRGQHDWDMLNEKHKATKRDLRQLCELVKEMVKKIQELTLVSQFVTNLPIKKLADDSILYQNSKRSPSMTLLMHTIENILESLSFITRANHKRKIAIQKENYIHIQLEDVSDEPSQSNTPIRVSLLTSNQIISQKTDQDTEELYQMISSLRRANSKFKENHFKSTRRIEELEAELQRRKEQYQADIMDAEDIRKKYEKEREQQTMDTINMRNKLEKENEETRQLLQMSEENFDSERQELQKRIAELEKALSERVQEAPAAGTEVEAPPAASTVDTQEELPQPPAEQSRQEKQTASRISDAPPRIVLNINITGGESTPAPEETIEQIRQRPGTAKERIVYIEKVIEKEQTKLRDLFALLQQEKRVHQMETGEIMGPYADPHEDASRSFLGETLGGRKKNKSLRPIDRHVKNMEGTFSSNISVERLAQLRQEMSENTTQEDFGVQVQLLGKNSAGNEADNASDANDESLGVDSSAGMDLLPKNERLREIVLQSRRQPNNTRPKSLLWLLKLISNVYKGKLLADQTENKKPTLPEYVFVYLKKFYGTDALVDEYASSIMSSVNRYQEEDLRVAIFGRFMLQSWDTTILDEYLKVWNLLESSKFGPDFSKRNGDDGPVLSLVSKIRTLKILSEISSEGSQLYSSVSEILERISVDAPQREYEDAIQRAGFKTKGKDKVDARTVWGVTEEEAKKVVRKAEFLEAFCEVFASIIGGSSEFLIGI